MPIWLEVLAIVLLALGATSALVVAIDLVHGHPQSMWIMDVVWPVTGLWAGPVGVWAYFRFGRAGARPAVKAARQRRAEPPNETQPFSILAAKSTTHCGAGCSLGDLTAEWLAFVVPLSLFGHKIFGAWIYDYVLAFTFGIAFQYFTIKPMKHLSRGQGLVAAVKADTLSLSAWQVGMYGWMAIATFAIFGHEIVKTDPVFWFMMQIAMWFGFATSYPVNRWLLRRGLKEKM